MVKMTLRTVSHESRLVHVAVIGAIVGSVLFASCGGSSGSAPSLDTSGAPPIEQTADTTVSDIVDETGSATGISEACIELSLAISTATAGMVPGSGSQLDIDSLDRSFDAIKSVAPSDIGNDIEIVKNGMSNYLSILAEFGNDFAAVSTDTAAAQRLSGMFDETFSEASERFSAWLQSVCEK